MEEEKAAAYYDELTRKGEGAARFKQGLGFSSSSNDAVPARGSSSSSSFLNQFVKASSPNSIAKLDKESQLQSIQNKLAKKKTDDCKASAVSERKERRRRSRSRSRSRERYRDHGHRKSDRDRHRDRDRDRDRDRHKDKRRSRSRSFSPDKERRRSRRSSSPERARRRSRDGRRERRRDDVKKEKDQKIDYSQLIDGYDTMSAAERVKAKMKLQLADTAKKDTLMGSGWERFEFDREASLDDEEVEAGDDDAKVVKQIGQSFRFSAIEARREEQVKAAHDEAMFGAPALTLSTCTEDELEADNLKKNSNENSAGTSLLSEKVLEKQQVSWRDRARKV